MKWLLDPSFRLAVTSLIFPALFFSQAIALFVFARIAAPKTGKRLKYSMFGVASLLFGIYSFAVFHIHSQIEFFAQRAEFFTLLEFGFALFISLMGFQLLNIYSSATEQLEHRTKEIEGLNQEMQFLISSIAHDLRAPLLTIQGFADLLLNIEVSDKEKSQDYLKRIRQNALNMNDMLEDLLKYLKLGQVPEPVEGVDLAEVASEVLTALPEGAGRKIELPSHWPPLFSSAKGIRQILLNLLQNAVKFSEGTEGNIEVECLSDRQGMTLRVSDHGPGVPETVRKKIFQPFFHYGRTFPGSGMGLAIVRKTAERLGGKVWLDEDYLNGARFCVFLPNQAIE